MARRKEDRTNAERQRRYIARLKAAAKGGGLAARIPKKGKTEVTEIRPATANDEEFQRVVLDAIETYRPNLDPFMKGIGAMLLKFAMVNEVRMVELLEVFKSIVDHGLEHDFKDDAVKH